MTYRQLEPMPRDVAWSGAQRVGDVERSAVCEALSAHYAAGRLSDDELDQRVSAAVAARTRGDLWPLLADLPPPAAMVAPAPPPLPLRPTTTIAWGGVDAFALVVLLATLAVALCGASALVVGAEFGFVVVAALAATTAGTGGVALGHLLHRSRRARQAECARPPQY